MVADTSYAVGDSIYQAEIDQNNYPTLQRTSYISGPMVDPTGQNGQPPPPVSYSVAVNTEVASIASSFLGYPLWMWVGGAGLVFWFMNSKHKRGNRRHESD